MVHDETLAGVHPVQQELQHQDGSAQDICMLHASSLAHSYLQTKVLTPAALGQLADATFGARTAGARGRVSWPSGLGSLAHLKRGWTRKFAEKRLYLEPAKRASRKICTQYHICPIFCDCSKFLRLQDILYMGIFLELLHCPTGSTPQSLGVDSSPLLSFLWPFSIFPRISFQSSTQSNTLLLSKVIHF